jgi:hypothetical protein
LPETQPWTRLHLPLRGWRTRKIKSPRSRSLLLVLLANSKLDDQSTTYQLYSSISLRLFRENFDSLGSFVDPTRLYQYTISITAECTNSGRTVPAGMHQLGTWLNIYLRAVHDNPIHLFAVSNYSSMQVLFFTGCNPNLPRFIHLHLVRMQISWKLLSVFWIPLPPYLEDRVLISQ